MKKIVVSMMSLLMICSLFISPTFAASYGISASKSSVNPGGSFSVSIGGDVTGRFNISVNNGSASSSSVWVENNTQSVTITAGSSGTVTITATPVAGLSDADGNPVSVSSRSTSVSIKTPSSVSLAPSTTPNSKPTQTVVKKEDTRSKDNNLSSISVSHGTLSPSFNKDTKKYTVSLSAETQEIEINAKALDSKAKVSGTGKKKVEAGKNDFVITCTAENGSQKNYSIEAIVDDKPLVFVEFNGKQLGVVRNFVGVDAPNGFKETTVKINDKETKAWTNDQLKKTIVSLVDDKEKSFYVYENGKITSSFHYITVNGVDLYVLDVDTNEQKKNGMTFTQVELDSTLVNGWTFNEKAFDNFFIIYAMNNEGEENYYQYEKTMKTIQLYSKSAPVTETNYNSIINNMNMYKIIMIIFITLTIILLGAVSVYYYKKIYVKPEHNQNG